MRVSVVKMLSRNSKSLKQTILIAVFLLIGSAIRSQNVYLVSVGISDYPGTGNDLVLPVSDAKAMVELYQKNNAATTQLLLNRDATKRGILAAMTSLYKKAKADDIIVFFFSGHGYPGGFVAYDEMLCFEDLRHAFSSVQAKHKMIFADACFSGTMRASNRASSQVKSDFDVLLFLSSRHDENSMEVPGMKNGFFTSCLVRCLKGGADYNKDRSITAKELYRGVREGVIALSQGKQHPVMWGNFNDDMVILKW